MIEIYYEGYNNKKEREIIESAASFASKRLFPRFKIRITFRFIKDLKRKERIEGDVDYEDDELNPREFTIRVHKGMKEEDLTTLVFHEFAHIKQYLYKELVYKFDTKNWAYKTYYKGKPVDRIDYYSQPHEIEAYKLQEDLYNVYLGFINT